jgi:hypothetical protein
MAEKKDAYRVLVGRTERMRPLRRSSSRWKSNIGMHHKVIGTEMVWLRIGQVVGCCDHGYEAFIP